MHWLLQEEAPDFPQAERQGKFLGKTMKITEFEYLNHLMCLRDLTLDQTFGPNI